jgi:hypothetical protein
LDPLAPKFLELPEDLRFKASKDVLVCPLHLPIGPWMFHRHPSHVDLLIIAEPHDFTSCELGAIVCDDGVHNDIAVYDFFDELDCVFGIDHSHKFSLNPISKLINWDK